MLHELIGRVDALAERLRLRTSNADSQCMGTSQSKGLAYLRSSLRHRGAEDGMWSGHPTPAVLNVDMDSLFATLHA
eukprot:scaffold165582_cov31-Tisochrysis_lutea.AAC.1